MLARLERVVFGAFDPKAGAVGSVWDVVRDRRLNHRPEVVAGVRGPRSPPPCWTRLSASAGPARTHSPFWGVLRLAIPGDGIQGWGLLGPRED